MANQLLDEKNTLYEPTFPENWTESFLYPLAGWLNGMAFKDFEFAPEGNPVIKIAEIKNGISGQTKFTNEKYDEKYLLKKGDMLFCWSGQPQTSIDVLWWNGPNGWLNQHIFKVTPKTNNKYFFFYLLKYLKPNFVQIAINKQTTGLGHVTKGDLERFVVKLPTSEEQDAIAAVLSSLDDKIELLREQNKTLEATAQAIFKEWFVNFNFPGATGRMIDSERGEIPEGWRVGRLGDVIELFDSKRIPLASGVRAKRKGIYPYYGATSIMDYIDDYLFDGTYLLLAEDGSVMDDKGRPVLQYVWGQFWVSNHSHVLQGKNGFSTEMLHTILKDANITGIVNGAVQLKINQANLLSFEIIIPNDDLLKKFDSLLQPIYQKTKNVITQIQNLSDLRDTLLPKLMKGEVRVEGFKE